MGTRRNRFLGRPAFAVLLFGLGLCLFAPPLLAIPVQAGGAALWLYLFAAWAALIAVLFARSWPRSRSPRPGRSTPDREQA